MHPRQVVMQKARWIDKRDNYYPIVSFRLCEGAV